MWTTVYVASGLENAEDIKSRLQKEGFLIRLESFTKEEGEMLYEILAPEFEAEDIEQAMIELGII